MSAGDLQVLIFRKISKYCNTQFIFCQGLQYLIIGCGHPVEDHAPDQMCLIVSQKTGDQRNYRSSHAFCIHYQYDGGLRHLCQMIGGAFLTDAAQPVIQSHDAFHDHKLAFPAILQKQLTGAVFSGKKGVQIPRGHPQHLPVEHRINIIRTTFAGRNILSVFFKNLQ